MAQQKKRTKWEQFSRLFLAHGSIDVSFFVIVLLLLCLGLVMVYSASYPISYSKFGTSTVYIKKQLGFAAVGLVGMLFVSKINYKRLKVIAAIVGYLGSLVLLIAVFFEPSGDGIHRWIYIGGQQIQPSEFAKLGLILFCAYVLSEWHEKTVSKKELQWGRKINAFFRVPLINESLIPIGVCGGAIALFVALVFLESHLSGTVLMALIGVVMLYLGGVRKKWFICGFILLSLVVVVLYTSTDFFRGYMVERIESWLDKDADPLGARWQTNQALYAIGSGGLFGTGLGGSKQKYLYVSEPQNDMIFSIICEETGVIGAGLIILLFCLLIWRGVVIGINAEDRYGMLLSMGIVFQVGAQVFLNIAVATDTLPNTGISLPFFSAGGTSLVIMMLEMGLLLSISRQSRLRKGTVAKSSAKRIETEET